MKIVDIRTATTALNSPFRNAYVDFGEMTVSLVCILTDQTREGQPVVGFGFNSIGRYAQQCIIRDRLIPRLTNAPAESFIDADTGNIDPFRAWKIMMRNEKPGGHGERSAAVGAIDMALWDIAAKVEGKPLFEVLSERYARLPPQLDIPVYAAGGYYHQDPIAHLQQEVQGYLEQGFLDVKIKIGGAPMLDDLTRIESVLELLPRDCSLAVDANAKFTREEALQCLRHLENYDLRWYEEATDPLDFASYAVISAETALPLATGENIFSLADVANLLRYANLDSTRDFIQVDPSLSYGLVEYFRILDRMHESGWSSARCIPHGGHLFLMHVAAGLRLGGVEMYPKAFEPFGGLWEGVTVNGGTVRVLDAPGVGFEFNPKLMDLFRDSLLTA